jgi:hypothetical protein
MGYWKFQNEFSINPYATNCTTPACQSSRDGFIFRRNGNVLAQFEATEDTLDSWENDYDKTWNDAALKNPIEWRQCN